MRVFKTKWFARFARRERISNDSLAEAIRRAELGLVDASLGGAIIKLRIARPGQGRSSGYRALIAYRRGVIATFLYGFAKSERENVEGDELQTAREIARAWVEANTDQLAESIAQGVIQEVEYEQQEGK